MVSTWQVARFVAAVLVLLLFPALFLFRNKSCVCSMDFIQWYTIRSGASSRVVFV